MKLFSSKFLAMNFKPSLSNESDTPTGRIQSRVASMLSKNVISHLKKGNTYVEIISALLIILFIYTGINKLLEYEKFSFELDRSPFIKSMSGFIAATLPIGELLLASTLIFNKTRLMGLYLSFALMALFTGYIWIMLNYAYDLPCSCGGVLAALSWPDHLIFNALFTLLAMTALILHSRSHDSKLQASIQ